MLDTFRKLRALLSPREQRQALLLLCMMLVVGVVEMAGVASIFPLIAVLSEPSLVETNSWLKLAYEGLGFADLNSFYIFLSGLVFLVVVGRTAMTALNNYAILRFSSMRSHSLSVRLLRNFLGRPYSWFLDRHSSDLGKTVLAEVGEVVGGALLPMMQLVSQAVVASCIILLVILVDPVVATISVVVLGLAYGGIYMGVRNLISRIGQDRLEANRQRFQIAQEALSGIKEVKVGGLEHAYLRRFEAASYIFERRRSGLQVLADTPRYVLEVIAIGGMLVVIMALLLRNQGNIAAALPALATFAFAGLRLLPVVQGLYRSAVMVRAAGPALDRIQNEFSYATEIPPETVEPLPLESAIELRNVEFTYPNSGRPTLRDISCRIEANSSVAFIGKTGAGKSTIVDLILGLVTPQSGELLVDGVPLDERSVRRWQRSIGYVPQHIFLADETIAANIAFGVPEDQIDMKAVERAAKMAALHEFVTEDLPLGYETTIGERGIRLSGGQRQRIAIARALYVNPDVLVLDEATSALDEDTENLVIKSIKEVFLCKTIIIISHRPSSLQFCDCIYHVNLGNITLHKSKKDRNKI
ncbi:ABC transporter ATP-binding protein [Devosia honganensis]|uniref:ABC transporter ATP-binding protein n=1 Tax=Devosia honganensis TaxID=1610527 RepID=A0ABV7WZV8_9HYPH